jgi:hypothetical protein
LYISEVESSFTFAVDNDMMVASVSIFAYSYYNYGTVEVDFSVSLVSCMIIKPICLGYSYADLTEVPLFPVDTTSKSIEAYSSKCFYLQLLPINYDDTYYVTNFDEIKFCSFGVTSGQFSRPRLIVTSSLWHPGIVHFKASKSAPWKPLSQGFTNMVLTNIQLFTVIANFTQTKRDIFFFMKITIDILSMCGKDMESMLLNKSTEAKFHLPLDCDELVLPITNIPYFLALGPVSVQYMLHNWVKSLKQITVTLIKKTDEYCGQYNVHLLEAIGYIGYIGESNICHTCRRFKMGNMIPKCQEGCLVHTVTSTLSQRNITLKTQGHVTGIGLVYQPSTNQSHYNSRCVLHVKISVKPKQLQALPTCLKVITMER